MIRKKKKKKLLAFLNIKIKVKKATFLELQMHRIHHMQYFKLNFLNYFNKVKDSQNLQCSQSLNWLF